MCRLTDLDVRKLKEIVQERHPPFYLIVMEQSPKYPVHRDLLRAWWTWIPKRAKYVEVLATAGW